MPQMLPMLWVLLFLTVVLFFYYTFIKLFFGGLPNFNQIKPVNFTHSNSSKWMW